MAESERQTAIESTLTGNADLELPEFDLPPEDPISLLSRWFLGAEERGVIEPLAMVLATAGHDSAPSTRVVLVKSLDEAGLVFGTNRGSRKGVESSESASAAGSFYWRETLQQINVAGRVEQLSPAESDALFSGRGPRARAASLAADQSQPMGDLEALRTKAEEILESGDLTRSDDWVACRLRIERIEFWHGSTDRLHRRLEYRLNGGRWAARRLQP